MSDALLELPDGWEWCELQDVAEVRLGRQRSPKNHQGDNMVPYLRAANVTWDGLDLSDVKEMNFTPGEVETYALQEGDIVLAEASGSASEVGKPAIWQGEIERCCFQNTLIRVRSEGPLPEYLLVVLREAALSGAFAGTALGVGIHHLGASRLSRWQIPLPPIEEQRRVAERADAMLAELEAGTSELAAVEAALPSLRFSALRSLLGVTGDSHALSDVVDVLDRYRVPVNREERAKRVGNVPYYGAAGQVGWIDEPLFDEELVLLGEDGIQFFDPYAQKAYVIGGPSWVNNHAHVLRPNPQLIRTRFLLHALNATDYSELANGTTRLKLTKTAMERLRLWVPDLQTQDAVLRRLDGTFAEADVLQRDLDSVSGLASALRLRILGAALSGALSERQAGDRSASDQIVAVQERRKSATKSKKRHESLSGSYA